VTEIQIPLPSSRVRKSIAALPRHWPILVLLSLALVARGLVVWHWRWRLDLDLDAYLSLGEQLASGAGFISPNTGLPTAYRPPLYPALVACLFRLTNSRSAGIDVLGLVQVLLGTVTVWLTWTTARRVFNDKLALAAALLTALDPLLLLYTSYAMTETLAALFAAGLLWLAARGRESDIKEFVNLSAKGVGAQEQQPGMWPGIWPGMRWGLLLGVAFGLAALCRPTFLGAFGIWLIWVLAGTVRRSLGRSEINPGDKRETGTTSEIKLPWRSRLLASDLVPAGAALAGLGLILSLWGARNLAALGHPVITTTHGGYTLLLANNRVQYEEIDSQGWRGIWDETTMREWTSGLETEMQAAGIASGDEMASDRWMSERARNTIRAEPLLFARAVLWRFFRFFGLTPRGDSLREFPPIFEYTLISWYVTLYVLAVTGGVAVIRNMGAGRLAAAKTWEVAFSLLAGFVGAHLLYWSDARMRTPLMPVLALLAAAGLEQVFHALKSRREKCQTSSR